MKHKNNATIGGNGFQHINDYRVERLANHPQITLKQLAMRTTQISRVLNDLTKVLENMPTEMFELIGKDILEFANHINDLNGEIGMAHDARLEA